MGGSLLLLEAQTFCFSLRICLYSREHVCFNYRKTFSFTVAFRRKNGAQPAVWELVMLKPVLLLQWNLVCKVPNYKLGVPRFKSWVHIIFCEAQ